MSRGRLSLPYRGGRRRRAAVAPATNPGGKADGRHAAAALLIAAALSLLGASASDLPLASPDNAAPAPSRETRLSPAAQAPDAEMRKLVAELDAARFPSRNRAARRLASQGESAVPYLVDALGAESSELRFRARVLLSGHNSFEEVAPHLADAVGQPYGPVASAILRQRVLQQVDVACRLQFTGKLFKFWGVDEKAFRDGVLTRLAEAKTRAESAHAIEPLLGLGEKTTAFNNAVSRLESLSLPYDHRYSPGFVIAQTLARGLQEGDSARIAFAQKHLEAFEALVAELHARNAPAHVIRKEVSDRANMSQGAASYLVGMLDKTSPQRELLRAWMDVPPERLQEEFFRGLASADSRKCNRDVGKVHIVDMLTESLGQWPGAPRDGVVGELIAGVSKTVASGDKPKALAFLDALDACRDLSHHRLSIRNGLGERLGRRLALAARTAPNNRAYYPARIVHNKFLALIDMGFAPEHRAFPEKLFEEYLAGAARATSDEQQLALERYRRILERLRAADLSFDQPGVEQFALAMRDSLTENRDLLAQGAAELQRLLDSRQNASRVDEGLTINRALGQWTRKTMAQSRADRIGDAPPQAKANGRR